MFTVAVIGGDGAGKTTIAQGLVRSSPFPMKYLYMGGNIESSNVALPTSRLILWWKLHSYRRQARKEGQPNPDSVSTYSNDHRFDKRGSLGAMLRLAHRVVEEGFRQVVSWVYQLRGYAVVYDRHFLFDVAPRTVESRVQKQRLSDRVHYWFLRRLYPHPDLVILLDAPPEVLFARKGEATLDYLSGRRGAFLEEGKRAKKFVRVDATQSPEKVLADALEHMITFHAWTRGRARPVESPRTTP